MDGSEPTVYRRMLSRAIKVAGGVEKLSTFLNLPLEELGKWASGESNPPCCAFLALTDIVASNYLTPAALKNFSPKRR